MPRLGSELPPFTEEQLAVLRAEQQRPACKFVGVPLDQVAELDDATIVQMCSALMRSNVKLTYDQLAQLAAANDFEHTDMDQRGNVDFERVMIPDPDALSTEELIATREYARDVETHSLEELIEGCVASLRLYGFCVVDHVVPRDMVDAVRHELSEGMPKPGDRTAEERYREGPSGSSQTESELIHQPLYCRYLCHPAVVGIAKTMLDSHVRIAQHGRRNVGSDDQMENGEKGGFGPAANRGPLGREWHTDWPHDLSAYGAGSAENNAGTIRQPFPDVCMCLSMVWYMIETGPDSMGTWVVPGAHRDVRNPRGPKDGITVSAPIPGEMQVSAPAGSVFIQDSRMWHSTACHNTSGQLRVAGQNRWVPWWLNASYGGGEQGYGATPWLSEDDLAAMPEDLQPLLTHLCVAKGPDRIQQPVLNRAQAANDRNAWGFARVGEPGLEHANAHIIVKPTKTTTRVAKL